MDGRTGRGAGRGHLPGFAAVEVLYDEQGAVRGVATGDMGVARDGSHTDHYQPGMELHARYTVFAEGARQLGRQLIERFKLDDGRNAQSYGIGIKEMWEVDPAQSKPGLVIHTAGWPLDADTYGGSFLYHLDNNLVAVGLIVGLDYPWLSPFDEFQRYKTHPPSAAPSKAASASPTARAPSPRAACWPCPSSPCPAACWSAARPASSTPRASRAAMPPSRPACWPPTPRSTRCRPTGARTSCPPTRRFKSSWLHEELNKARNFKQWFKKGRTVATVMTGIEQLVLKGNFLDAAQQQARPRQPAAGLAMRAHRLSQARRQAHVRQAQLGVHLEHQP